MNQQARADQQDERQGHLRRDEERPQPLAVTIARGARLARVQRAAFAKLGRR